MIMENILQNTMFMGEKFKQFRAVQSCLVHSNHDLV